MCLWGCEGLSREGNMRKSAMHCWGKLVSPNALGYSRDLCAAAEFSALLFSVYPSPHGREMPVLVASTYE